MRPGEGQADDGDGVAQREEKMAERQPPAGEDEPNDVAERAERTGAEILAAGRCWPDRRGYHLIVNRGARLSSLQWLPYELDYRPTLAAASTMTL